METLSKQELIDFEKSIADLFDNGQIPYLIHLSGGNEEQLIEIFKEIKEGDYIFSTHRSHYHYLLAGGSKESLKERILNGKSMFVFDKKLNFLSSSIVAGTPAIAAGVAWALKRKKSNKKVWCFIGDGAEEEGHFYEAVRYVDGWDLPCTFIIEDNNRCVDSPKSERYNKSEIQWPKCVKRYCYTPTYPHGGTGNFAKIITEPRVVEIPEREDSYINLITNFSEKLKYKDAVKKAMENLAKDERVIFIGYNVKHGSAYGTLSNVNESQRLETPLAENLMIGLGMGMSLEGFKPVVFFERHDFIFNAIDGIVNHLDKISILSDNQFSMPVIIKAVAGAKKPLYSGITHTQDYTNALKSLVNFPIFEPKTSLEVLNAYHQALSSDKPCLVVEKRELYDKEF